jgi:voltage-gated potassium channel Kch
MKFRVRLRAWFDGTMDRGTPALIGWLGLASVLLIAVVTALVMVFAQKEADDRGVAEVAWESLMRAMDPGTIGGDSGSVVFLGLMLAVTIGGIFIVSSLVGVLTTGMENRIAELRKGRSQVAERGHAVLLGWSDQIFIVVSELAKANQGRKRSCVVILADQDKVFMEDQVRSRIGDTGRLRIVCRSGSPLKKSDLELVSLNTARSVMVLSPAGEDADIDVIKALLLLNYRPWGPDRPHVVAAVQSSENLAAAKLAAGPYAQIIDADDIAVRLVVQSNRQSGLSTVCTDLLDFSGNEMYMRAEPALVGRTYGEALSAYEQGCPIGLHHADDTFAVNPPMDTRIAPGDQVILIAEDDLRVRLAAHPAPVTAAVVAASPRQSAPDRTLLIGWNARGQKILDLLERLVEPGSHVDIATLRDPILPMADMANLSVGVKLCDPTSRRSLEDLELGGYAHIVVLSDDSIEPDRADDRTLVTLLHLRDIEVRLGDPYSIVTEVNDDANREVAQVTKADDFIVSNKLISLLMTQLAENRRLQPVFAELFDPAGPDIHLKPAGDYVVTGTEVNFATVIEAARRRGETAIGYRRRSHAEEGPSYGVALNPPKSTPLVLTTADSVIVIALA